MKKTIKDDNKKIVSYDFGVQKYVWFDNEKQLDYFDKIRKRDNHIEPMVYYVIPNEDTLYFTDWLKLVEKRVLQCASFLSNGKWINEIDVVNIYTSIIIIDVKHITSLTEELYCLETSESYIVISTTPKN